MTQTQANALTFYFEEFQEPFIESRLFCECRSDNALLARMLGSGDIVLVCEEVERINCRNVKNNTYKLTEKGVANYVRLTGNELPSDLNI